MENKQYPPRGEPPLVYRCRGIPGDGWREFRFAHLIPEALHECIPWENRQLAIPITIGSSWQNRKAFAQKIPEGLHVYRKAVSKENSTPSGVAPSAYVWCYKHLMPLASFGPKLRRIRDDTGLHIRDDPDSYREDLHIRDGTGSPGSARHGPTEINGRASPVTGRASPKNGRASPKVPQERQFLLPRDTILPAYRLTG